MNRTSRRPLGGASTKMKTLSLLVSIFAMIRTINVLSAANPHHESRQVRRFRLASNLTWSSSRAFCLSRGMDLCSYERTCGKYRRPFGGQIKGSHWVPVQDRFNDWVQVGTASPNSLCLRFTDLAIPPRSPSWGTRRIGMDHKGRVFCCARDPKTAETPVFLFEKIPRRPEWRETGTETTTATTTTTSNETHHVRGLSLNGCARLCLSGGVFECHAFRYRAATRGCFVESTQSSKIESSEGEDAYRRADLRLTSCGKSGKSGPSYNDCLRSYATTPIIDMLTVEGGIQFWSVPVGGKYRIEIAAPSGRQWMRGVGGYGVILGGTFRLQQGTILKVLVGQQSDYAGGQKFVGGSGGTFVSTINNLPLMVAGGGASSSQMLSANHDTTDGNVRPNGKHASAAFKSWGHAGEAGGGGQRGYTASGTGASGGGAGFYGNAAGYNSSENSWLVPAKAFVSPEEPGVGEEMYSEIDHAYNNGGFGGGGAAGEGGGGGGGGFSGGGGGPKRGWAGGGGSFNGGANAKARADNTGLGWVKIAFLEPEPAETSLRPAKIRPETDKTGSSTDIFPVVNVPSVSYHGTRENESLNVSPHRENEFTTSTISEPSVNVEEALSPAADRPPNRPPNRGVVEVTTLGQNLSEFADNDLFLSLGSEDGDFPHAVPRPTIESILTAHTRDRRRMSAVYLAVLVCGLLVVALFMVVVAIFLRRCYFASKAKYVAPRDDFDAASVKKSRKGNDYGGASTATAAPDEADYEEPWPDLTDVLSASSRSAARPLSNEDETAPQRHAQSSASMRSCDYSTGYTTISTLRSEDATGVSPDVFLGGHLYCSISAARGCETDGGGGDASSAAEQQSVALLTADEDFAFPAVAEASKRGGTDAREPSILTTHDSDHDEETEASGSESEGDRSDASEEITSDIDFQKFSRKDPRSKETSYDDESDDDDDTSLDYAIPHDSVIFERKGRGRKPEPEKKILGRSNGDLPPARREAIGDCPPPRREEMQSKSESSPEASASPVRSKSYIVRSAVRANPRNPTKPRPRRTRSDPRQCPCGSSPNSLRKDVEDERRGFELPASRCPVPNSVTLGHTTSPTPLGPSVFLSRNLPDLPTRSPTPPSPRASPLGVNLYAPLTDFGTAGSSDNSVHYACTDITDIIKKQLISTQDRARPRQAAWDGEAKSTDRLASTQNDLPNRSTNKLPNIPNKNPPGLFPLESLGYEIETSGGGSGNVGGGGGGRGGGGSLPFSMDENLSSLVVGGNLRSDNLSRANIEGRPSNSSQPRRAPYPNFPLPSPPKDDSDPSEAASAAAAPNAREAAALRHSVLTAIENQLIA